MDDEFGKVPFTLEQARAAGITRAMLRSGRYRRLFCGVFVSSDVEPTLRVRAAAALLVVPGGAVSHHTAAELSGACAPPCDQIHVSMLRGRHTSRLRISGIAAHEVRNLDCTERAGLRITTPVRTFLDLAGRLELTELVATGDAFVRRTAATPELFSRHAAEYRGRGALCRPGRCRTRTDRGRLADGVAAADAAGWLVRVVTAADVYSSPLTLLGRIHEDLTSRRHPGVQAALDLTRLPSFAA